MMKNRYLYLAMLGLFGIFGVQYNQSEQQSSRWTQDRRIADSGVVLASPLLRRVVHKQDSSDIRSGNLQLIQDDASIRIRSGEQTILVYNKVHPPLPPGIKPAYRRSGFLHPVVSPSGQVVTDVYPADHPHQNGVFSAWVMTRWNDREIDFWNLGKETGRVSHEQVVSTFSGKGKIGFEVDLTHSAVQQPTTDILRERWNITAWETDGSYHMFDLKTTQTALTDRPLFIEKYHYGGVGYRGSIRWLAQSGGSNRPDSDVDTESEAFGIVNDQGEDRIRGDAKPTRWIAVGGQIDGRPVSITVLCHQDNFRAPQAVRMHPTKPYFAFSPCVDGAFTIDKQNSYRATYRYLVTDAEPDAGWINDQWARWHSEQKF
jgi:hypothetical protein